MSKRRMNPRTSSLERSGRVATALAFGSLCGAAALAVVLGSPPAAATEDAAPKAQDDDEHESAVEVIYTGFVRGADHGAQVFVHMTGKVPVEPSREGNTLTYRLTGAKLGVPNNANPLPTRLFGPPVSRVSLVAGEQGVDLVIQLSGASEPTHELLSQGSLSTLLVKVPSASK